MQTNDFIDDLLNALGQGTKILITSPIDYYRPTDKDHSTLIYPYNLLVLLELYESIRV